MGNRNIAWQLAALAMITTPISGVTFISVPGMVVKKGFTYLQMCIGFVVGYFIIAWFLIPLFYKRQVVSIYSFLEQRFGNSTYKTGAWLFLISKIMGMGVRFLVVCAVLQVLVFEPLHIPFVINVFITIFLIWVCTVSGGVKSVIWTDTVKSLCLIGSLLLCIYFLTGEIGISLKNLSNRIGADNNFQIFNFDSPSEASYFWKQFLAGVFLVIAMTGLDQDMMQHTLAVSNSKGSRKNLYVSGIVQFFVMVMFLSLGALLIMYAESKSIEFPEKSDDLFALVAFHSEMPLIVGILFILGLISSSYSSVGSALTSLTTSYTIDILDGAKIKDQNVLKRKRIGVHSSMAAIMIGIILLFYYLNEQDAISAVYTLASYTYGPILGLFVFGMFSKRKIENRLIPYVCLFAPLLSWLIQWISANYYAYSIGFELLLINALLTITGLVMLPKENIKVEYETLQDKLTT